MSGIGTDPLSNLVSSRSYNRVQVPSFFFSKGWVHRLAIETIG